MLDNNTIFDHSLKEIQISNRIDGKNGTIFRYFIEFRLETPY